MKLRILRALLKKEVRLMLRNPIIPKIIFAMPVMVMLVLPLVANLDIKSVNVSVVDNDHSELSRRIISDMGASGTIVIANICNTHGEAMTGIENGEADVLLTIPPDYARDMVSGLLAVDLTARGASSRSAIDVEANGVNATKGMLGAQYVSKSVMGTLERWRTERGLAPAVKETGVINRYNPTLDFRNYMIPALMVVLLIIICGFVPALNLVNEKESGTIEAINVTPVSRFIFVLSKLIPFWVTGLLVVTVGIVTGWLVYGLAPEGSVWAIYLASVLFSLVMSGLGVVIANKSDTMLQSIFVMFAIIMVFQLMGGLFTPISSMPEWAQCVTYAVPPRYFIEIMRSVYLKGATVGELWLPYAALGGYAALTCVAAALTYAKRN